MNLRPHRRGSPDINLTPLIDVVFLLLIFFMVSTTFEHTSQIELALPEASAEGALKQPDKRIDITIDKEGHYYVNDKGVSGTDLASLRRAILKASELKPDLPVTIYADSRTPHQAVITAMDAASQLGYSKMSFATRRQDADE